MIYKSNTAKSAIITRIKEKVAVYWGEMLKWQSVRSCYGRGYWIPEKPWVDGDTWKNNA